MTPEAQALLLKAATVATRAHAGHKRKDGSPYIAHPMRVAFRVSEQGVYAQIVALLHDVVEDTDVTLDDLTELGFPEPIRDAVDRVTKRPGETYRDFIDRARQHDISRVVKIADIEDNLADQSALDPEEADFLRKRYTKALEKLR